MHLVSDAHGYPMFAKACWESIKAAYTSASITDGMDLYRDLNKVFYDPSLGVAKLLDQMDLLRRKLAVAAVTFADPIWVSMVASKLLDGSDAWLSCRGTIKNLQRITSISIPKLPTQRRARSNRRSSSRNAAIMRYGAIQ
ncbi:hypothetical protein BASA83_007748 [Batrachochytrium salamandrivorans]|nr:hypothetical protein BASA83_007748 [Batrachochytrium salamandrivorans]